MYSLQISAKAECNPVSGFETNKQSSDGYLIHVFVGRYYAFADEVVVNGTEFCEKVKNVNDSNISASKKSTIRFDVLATLFLNALCSNGPIHWVSTCIYHE